MVSGQETMKTKIFEFIKNAKTKVVEFVKTNVALSVGIAALVLATVAFVVIACMSGNAPATNWGTGLTEGIPAFSGNYTSLESSDKFTAAYYSDVTGEQIDEYISKLENDCGIKFKSEMYPRSASYNDKLLVLHYNVTEKKFSVTVSLKGDSTIQENTHDNQELD
jgi:hypothetical protein